MSTLIFKLDAPMQSYGDTSYYRYRTTYSHPTKSAIIGMIAAALGLRRGDKRIKDLDNSLHMNWTTIKHGSLLVDYQNVHYTVKKSTAIKQVWRYYIQDGSFEIQLQGERELLEKIKYALTHPYFSLYIGRRSCPLSKPLNPVIK